MPQNCEICEGDGEICEACDKPNGQCECEYSEAAPCIECGGSGEIEEESQ